MALRVLYMWSRDHIRMEGKGLEYEILEFKSLNETIRGKM